MCTCQSWHLHFLIFLSEKEHSIVSGLFSFVLWSCLWHFVDLLNNWTGIRFCLSLTCLGESVRLCLLILCLTPLFLSGLCTIRSFRPTIWAFINGKFLSRDGKFGLLECLAFFGCLKTDPFRYRLLLYTEVIMNGFLFTRAVLSDSLWTR